MTSKFDRWPWKTIGHLSQPTSTFVHHFVTSGEFKLELQSRNAQFGSKSVIFFYLCDLEIWRMTLKNNTAPFPCYFKLSASFHNHQGIKTGVMVWKWLNWVLTFVTLTFDLWPFAWTSLLSLVITPENFMMIQWWEHSERGVTDRWMDWQPDGGTEGRTDWTIHRAAWSQLKMYLMEKLRDRTSLTHSTVGDKWRFCGRWPHVNILNPGMECWLFVKYNFHILFIHSNSN